MSKARRKRPDSLPQFPDVDAYVDISCDPSHFGFYVPDPRFCLVDLWEKHLSYRDMCPGGALDGPRGSSEGGFGPYSEPDQTVTLDGKTFQRKDSRQLRDRALGEFLRS